MSHRKLLVTLLTLLFLSVVIASPTQAQTEGTAELKRQATALLKENNYTEALPILEKIAAAEPNDGETQFFLAFALLGKATNTKDNVARKALRIRARQAFVKAKSLNYDEPKLDALILSLPEDGSDSAGGFTSNAKANQLMEEGEALFSQGKPDEALRSIRRRLNWIQSSITQRSFPATSTCRKGITQRLRSGIKKQSPSIRIKRLLTAIPQRL